MSRLLGCPKTAAACAHTNSTSSRCCSSGGSACSCSANPAARLPERRRRLRAAPAKTAAGQSHTSATRPGERPSRSNTAGQSTATPVVNSRPAAVSSESLRGGPWPTSPPRSRRSAINDCSTAALKPAPGPTSTNTSAPSDSTVRTPSTNRTGCRTCSTQYCADPYPAPANCPVTLDTKPIRGSPTLMSPPVGRTRPSSAPSTPNETHATPPTDAPERPCCANRSATALTAGSAPEITTESWAVDRRDAHPSVSNGVTASSLAATATIAPPAGSSAISRPRAATSRAASCKRQHARDVGRGDLPHRMSHHIFGPMPQCLQQPRQCHLDGKQRRLGELGTFQQLRRRRPTSPVATAPADGRPMRRAASSKARANTGNRLYSSAPCPAIASLGRETRTPSCPAAPAPADIAPGSDHRPTPSTPPVRASRSLPTSTARCSNTERVVTSDHAHVRHREMRRRSARCADNRAAWFANACSERADTTHATGARVEVRPQRFPTAWAILRRSHARSSRPFRTTTPRPAADGPAPARVSAWC